MMKTKEVRATNKVRLYPTDEQELLLKQYCGAARWVYNWGLARWKQYHDDGLKACYYDLAKELVFIKKMDATCWLKEAQSEGLQQSLMHLERAFKRFFKKQASYPQFKKRGIRESFTFPQKVTYDPTERLLAFPKLGKLLCSQQPVKGIIKGVTVVKEGDGWYACIRTVKQVTERSPNTKTIGIDMGVATMATIHTGAKALGFPHHSGLDKIIKRIGILAERMMRKRRMDNVNSKNREKARAKLAKAYAKLTNMRRDQLHKLSSALVKRYGTIVVEALKIKNMVKSASGTLEQPGTNVAQKRGLNRVISKQAWGIFFSMLEYKCRWYGRTFVKVDPKNTSRTCPACNHIAKENRKSQAVFQCVACGHSDHADSNAAFNIRQRGLFSLIPT